MKNHRSRTAVIVFAVLAIVLGSTTPCWAEAEGYCYVVGYSYKLKQAFFSTVFMQMVRDVSYSDEEYTTDVELIQRMETQFQRHMVTRQNVDASQYTITARGAFKNETIGLKRLMTERSNYKKKGFKTTVLKTFTLR